MTENQENESIPSGTNIDGQQELEPDGQILVAKQDLTDLLQRGDIANTVSGLAELDPNYMGGAAGSILLVNWLNQLCGQVNDLQQENRSLQEQVIITSVKNAELAGELREAKSIRQLRGISITGGSILIGASLGTFSQSPILSVVTGLVGALLLAVGWDVPRMIWKSSS